MLTELTTQIRVQSGVAATSSVEVGDVLDEILLASERADVLGLRARGLNPIREPLLVTTAERLLRKCKRPVRVVKQPPPSGYGGALVGVDLSMHSMVPGSSWLCGRPRLRASAPFMLSMSVCFCRAPNATYSSRPWVQGDVPLESKPQRDGGSMTHSAR